MMEPGCSTLTEVLERLEAESASGHLEQLQMLQEIVTIGAVPQDQLEPVVDQIYCLLRDSNMQVRMEAIQTLQLLLEQECDSLLELDSIVLPALIDALGDVSKQIRGAAAHAMQIVLQQWGLPITLPKLAPAWAHRSDQVKAGALACVTAAIRANPALVSVSTQWQNLILEPAIKLLQEPQSIAYEAAMDCIAELYQQLGQSVLNAVNAASISKAQLRSLHAWLGGMQAEAGSMVDYSLIHPATKLLTHSSGSMTSRSNSSQQSTEAASSAVVTSPSKPSPSRQTSARSLEHANSTDSSKKGLMAAVPKAAVRRGGFKDAGGLSAAGELPQAMPIRADSERELKAEIQKIVKALDEKQDWTKRIEALLRLEGLVNGGAAGFDSFLDMLKLLQQPLTVQLNDRRSAVSRVACRSLSTLAAALGSRFDVHALYFLPIIFKITVFTVQVMAEAADLCAQSLLHYCPSAKLLKPLADVICTDKSAKLRQHCAKYMLQALEQWDLDSCLRSLDLVEASIRSAAQDSSSATRSHGRNMFGAYSRALPQHAQAFLQRMDSSLQEKLTQAQSQYVPGYFQLAEQPAQPTTAALSGSLPRMPSTPPSSRPPTGKAATQATLADAGLDGLQAASQQPMKRGSRKSIGGNALRILADTAQSTSTDAAECLRSAPPAQRMFHMPTQGSSAVTVAQTPQRVPTVIQGGPQRHPASRAATLAPPRSAAGAARPQRVVCPPMPSSYPDLDMQQVSHVQHSGAAQESASDAASDCSTSGQDMQSMTAYRPAPMHQLLALAESASTDWKARIDMFQAMQQSLQESSIQDASSWTVHGDKMLQLLLEHVPDPHFKVAHAALDALAAALQHQTAKLESHLDRLIPALSQRLTDAKEVLRSVAAGCLQTALKVYPLELCLPQLARSLDAVKSAKGRIALTQLFCATCAAAVTTAAALPALRLAALAGDRNAEVRRAACQALQVVYTHMDGPTLLAHIAQARPPDQMTLRRALSPLIPNLDAQLAPYSGSNAVQSTHHRPSTAHSSSSTGDAQLLRHPESATLPQVLHAADVRQAGSAMLGDVTNIAPTSTLSSPRFPSAAAHDHASLHHQNISGVPDALHKAYTGQQQQQCDSKGQAVPLIRQKHITVDTRPNLKQTVIHAATLPAAQAPSLPADILQGASTQPVLHDVAARGTVAAHNHNHAPSIGRVPFAEHPDPQGNCIGRSHRSHHAVVHPGPNSGLAYSNQVLDTHVPQTMHASDSPANGRPVLQSPGQVAYQLSSVQQGWHATAGVNPETVQAVDRAALVQTSLQAQQADEAAQASAVTALLRLVTAADPAQLQQCLPQVVPALVPALQGDQWQAQEAALASVKVLVRQVGPDLQPWLAALLPALLQSACSSRPQVCMAADETCSLLLPVSDAAACLALLTLHLPATGTINTPACQPAPLIQASVKNIGRAVQQMPSADLLTELQSPDLLPGLFEAFDHQSADVRKAVTMCLMHMWQVVGDDLKPFLSPLRVSKIKLVTAYVDQAQGQKRMALQR